MLFFKYVRPHFICGVIDVHVIFDSPGSLPEIPKELEQRRRDMKKSDTHQDHDCLWIWLFHCNTWRWRCFISCRQCKQNLIKYMANAMLDIAPSFINCYQEFCTNINEVANSTNSDEEELPRPALYSNADESDNRIWLHCIHSYGARNSYTVQKQICTTLLLHKQYQTNMLYCSWVKVVLSHQHLWAWKHYVHNTM